jgi:hypothetical protein
MNPIKHKRQPVSYWQNHIEQWQQSGVSQRVYCQEHNLALNTFGNWKRKLVPVSTSGDESDPFVELSMPSGDPEKTEPTDWDIELCLGSDIILRLRRQ